MSSHHLNKPTRVPIPIKPTQPSRPPSRIQPSRPRSQQTGPEWRDTDCIQTSRPLSQAATAAAPRTPVPTVIQPLRVPSTVLPEPPTQVEVPLVVSPVAQPATSRRSILVGPSIKFTQVTIKTIQDADDPVQATAGPSVPTAPNRPEPGEDSQANMPVLSTLTSKPTITGAPPPRQ